MKNRQGAGQERLEGTMRTILLAAVVSALPLMASAQSLHAQAGRLDRLRP
jgi:hypothetical protein